MNPVEIEEAVTQLASEPFDRAEFPFQFLTAFGNKKTTTDRLRKGNTNQSDLHGGVLQRSNIHIATCAPGAVGETLNCAIFPLRSPASRSSSLSINATCSIVGRKRRFPSSFR